MMVMMMMMIVIITNTNANLYLASLRVGAISHSASELVCHH